MRLLKTGPYPSGKERLEFQECNDQDLPTYAILSHRWSHHADDEVSYADVHNGTGQRKPGFSKIRAGLVQAQRDGCSHFWVDTCCIDKSSSADLSEAINSMYRYYAESARCYAYLEDVSATTSGSAGLSSLGYSRWFTRGWTLQELLAPQSVSFWGKEWTQPNDAFGKRALLGDKLSLSWQLSAITGIERDILEGKSGISGTSIAERMYWASRRSTSRLEDQAYCLMGLFDVNMPMLYGEGKKAFFRLQEAIIKQSDDPSIFAWELPECTDPHEVYGLLADSPKAFANSGLIRPFNDRGDGAPYTISNKGLSLELPLKQVEGEPDLYIAALHCQHLDHNSFPGIYLRKVPGGRHQYARVNPRKLIPVYEGLNVQPVVVHQPFIARNMSPQTMAVVRVFQVPQYIKEMPKESTRKIPITPIYEVKEAVYREVHNKGDTQMTALSYSSSASLPSKNKVIPTQFKMKNKRGALAAAVLYRRKTDGLKFVLMLGALTDRDVGFDIDEAEAPRLNTFQHYAHQFVPQCPGAQLSIPFLQVRVDVDMHWHAGVTVYHLDVHIQATPKEFTLPQR